METAEKPIALKVHKTEMGHVIGACDRELLGKRVRGEHAQMHISSEFYFERAVSEEELAEYLEGCFTANLFGKRTISAYCKRDPSAAKSVVNMDGTPHLQVFMV